MSEVILDTLIDSIKLVPFLFLTYLAMEYLEHKAGEKTTHMVRKAGKMGPLIGGVAGVLPQCGFSAAASNLYAGRVITLGTLIAIYLSTSDEMLPILISEKMDIRFVLGVLGAKAAIGAIAGFVIDLLVRERKIHPHDHVHGHGENDHEEEEHIHEICEHENCHCERMAFSICGKAYASHYLFHYSHWICSEHSTAFCGRRCSGRPDPEPSRTGTCAGRIGGTDPQLCSICDYNAIVYQWCDQPWSHDVRIAGRSGSRTAGVVPREPG